MTNRWSCSLSAAIASRVRNSWAVCATGASNRSTLQHSNSVPGLTSHEALFQFHAANLVLFPEILLGQQLSKDTSKDRVTPFNQQTKTFCKPATSLLSSSPLPFLLSWTPDNTTKHRKTLKHSAMTMKTPLISSLCIHKSFLQVLLRNAMNSALSQKLELEDFSSLDPCFIFCLRRICHRGPLL